MKTEQLNQLVTNSPGSFPYQGLNEMTFLNKNVIILLFFWNRHNMSVDWHAFWMNEFYKCN